MRWCVNCHSVDDVRDRERVATHLCKKCVAGILAANQAPCPDADARDCRACGTRNNYLPDAQRCPSCGTYYDQADEPEGTGARKHRRGAPPDALPPDHPLTPREGDQRTITSEEL